ncbi:cytokine receptor common subunit gamma-like [Pristis pectinata]|uniref:cytokine receptor common subunit gamma-like n=1 Tax=Pristis pectinata TaxID=685728 RepID=UPI00223D7CAE|nr:cytokine receptor common subunit gamma-like [Pristis pectinata]
MKSPGVDLSPEGSYVNCIVHNEEFMECTWTHSEGEANYTLYYWYASNPAEECRNYIQQDGYNVGCNFSADEIIQFKDFYVFRNGSSDSGHISRAGQIFHLQDQVKPFPPGNLVANAMEDNGLLLHWDAPMPTERCLEYEVRYRENTKNWQKASVSMQRNFKLASVDPEKFYTFQVKSKVNIYCGTTQLWSEWSLPVHWGKFNTEDKQRSFNPLELLATVPVLGLFVLIIYLIHKRNLKMKV